MTSVDGSVFEEYSDWTEGQLLDALGKELMGDGLGVGTSDPGRRRRFSLRWLEEKREEVCTHESVLRLSSTAPGDRAMELTTLVTILAADEISRSATVMAALLIYRAGIRSFCAGL